MYVRRNENGQIQAISQQQSEEFSEWQPLYCNEVQQFLAEGGETLEDAKSLLQHSDEGFIRVLEDLIELLTLKGIIQFTELPSEVQKKLITRKSVRAQANKLVLFEEDHQSGEIKLPE
ncbi:tryptophan synthase subunit beta like protein [Thiomicrorhabdus sediminis]|uniref:Tryptophan synthase subunit beta like protein n=1 Tax=Thiomicrorhabdus sediminis TaxID=2580412 RepID=A0A4P9K6Q0_9GAMM|nr:tryptophan synthase subunit beta like protein [Thiomicrorhabdus sediminis]QCU90735.1 tryptophan synthase subunit beta like protein [Thiomicrorhabdus sediminis]